MKILLLGNGFDLYHKLPTRYDSFLHTVDFLQQHFDEKKTKTIGDVFGDQRLQDNDSFIPVCYEVYKTVYDITGIDNLKVKRLLSFAEHNMWFKYFLKSYNKNLGWIDFEKEISKVVGAFNDFLLECSTEDVFIYPSDNAKRYIINFFNFFHFYKRFSSDRSYSSDFGREEVRDDYKIEDPYGSEIYRINKEKIINELYNALLELAEMLKLYLDIFVNSPIEKMQEKGLIAKKSIFDDMGCVITFNYTETYEKLYTLKQIHHIHGDLNNKIIIGVNPDANDEPNIDNFVDTVFLQFKKYFQRVLNSSDSSYLSAIKKIKDNKKIFGNSLLDELYVAGHSLDVTDEDIIKEVFSLVDKIVVICHSTTAIADSINNLIKIYGKRDFDELRTRTDLEFKLYSDFE